MSLALSPTRQPVLADFWSHTRTVDVVTILAATGLTALAAQISIPIPGTPVPVTGQTFAVLLTAAALGPIRGGLAQFLYVALAFLGLPVLADHKGGASVVLGATGGYLLGFIVAAVAVGWLARRGFSSKPLAVFVSFIVGSAIIYSFGVVWLALSTGQSLGWAISKGMVPFLLGDLLKALLAAGLLPLAWKGLSSLDAKSGK